MLTKQQLAATLLNHRFVVEQSLNLKTIARLPASKLISITDKSSPDDIYDCVCSLMIYNRKHILENVERVFINHPVVSKFVSVISADSSNKRSSRFIIKLPEDIGKVYDSLIHALDHLSQNNDIREAAVRSRENFGLTIVNNVVKELLIDFNISDKEWYFSIPFVYEKFISNFDYLGKIISIFNFIEENLSKKEKAEIYQKEAYLIFSPNIKNEELKISGEYKVVETEEARIQREIKRKLAEAAKKRTKKVSNLVETTGENPTVSYIFEDGTQPLVMSVDVITQW